jgi:hypothetical protein
MKTKHWPGPWRIEGDQLKAANGYSVAHVSDEDIDEEFNAAQEKANYKRIVVCVNACEGIEAPEDFVRSALNFLARVESSEASEAMKYSARKLRGLAKGRTGVK